jgi:hypothetical protein
VLQQQGYQRRGSQARDHPHRQHDCHPTRRRAPRPAAALPALPDSVVVARRA